MYSLGVLLWELWCEQEPWGEMPATEICKNVVGLGHRLPLTEKHKDIEEVLQHCFSQPDDRPDPRKVPLHIYVIVATFGHKYLVPYTPLGQIHVAQNLMDIKSNCTMTEYIIVL